MSLAAKKKQRTYPYKDVTVCLDGELSAQRDSLMAQLKQKANDDRAVSGKPAILKEIAALEERMRDSLLTIRVTGTDYAKYNSIQFAHKPRKGRGEPYNIDTFVPDVVYKTSFEVDGDSLIPLADQDRGDWDDIVADLTNAEFSDLFKAVGEVNGVNAGSRFLDRNASQATPDSSETSDSPETSE